MKLLGGKKTVGIDIGSTKIRVAELDRNGHKVVLNYYDELEAPSLPPNERIEFLRTEGKNFLKRMPTRNALISLPGRGLLIRTLTVPNVPLKKLKDILKYEVQQQIPFPLEVVTWKFQILNQTPQNFNVLLGAAKKDLVNSYLSQLAPLNLNVEFLDTDLFALLNSFSFSHSFKEDKCQAILEIGAISSNFIIKHKEKLLMRSLTTSGDTIINSIMETENTSFGEAEKKKIEEGMKLPAVVSGIESLHTEIQNSIDYWRFTQKGPEVEELYLCGRGSELKGFKEFIEEKSRIKTLSPNFIEKIDINSKYSQLNEKQSELGVVLGIALRGIRESTVNINLLPVEVERMREFKENRTYFYLSSVMAILISLTPSLFINQEKIMLKSILQEINISLGEYEKFKPEVEKLNKEIKTINGKVGTIKGILTKKSSWLGRILEIGESLPSSRIYITSLLPGEASAQEAVPSAGTGEPQQPPMPPGAPPAGPPGAPVPAQPAQQKPVSVASQSAITLHGEVLITDIKTSFRDFKTFVQKLSELPFLKEVNINSCEINRENNKLTFALILKFE